MSDDVVEVECVDCGDLFETHVMMDREVCPECRGLAQNPDMQQGGPW